MDSDPVAVHGITERPRLACYLLIGHGDVITRNGMNQSSNYLRSLDSIETVEMARLVDLIISDAIEAGASDIHAEPWEDSLLVRIRLNGVLQELLRLPADLMEKVSGRLKVMANLVSYEMDRPQEGHAQTGSEMGGVELRMSFFPVIRGNHQGGVLRGEKIVIRIFDPKRRSFNLDHLGFESSTLVTMKHLLSKPSGMILLTGPTGSGKTTAIYAALTHLVEKHGSAISLSTVEDPVEYNLPMISQAQIHHAKDFTYPVALRSLMRQDPQVIMVGEIRDAETANIAVQAGLTGHLVISTIHSGSTAGVFARMINMKIEPFLLASSIIGVLGLRLIRTTCPYCAQPYQPEASYMKLISEGLLEEASLRHGGGCEHCVMTGFSGRVSVTEMLEVDEAVREAIMEKLPTRKLQEVAIGRGMKTLWQAGMERVIQGETPLEEIIRSIPSDR
ncbi:MAG: GspE/PulE family protein [Verrucomicrobiota bacterium]|nr:GspE/PulE family protein [Verrucomicrobiota bacterium]